MSAASMRSIAPAVRTKHDGATGAIVLVIVGVIAAAVRIRVLVSLTPFYYGTYDDGVHFATALNLLHGHLPYRDGVFLQPPGIVLAAVPFASLAPLVGDAHAFVFARGAFALLGAVNAVLVAALLRRMGLAAAISGGLIYAVSWPAVYTERSISLEVIGTTGVLLSLLLLRAGGGRRRWAVLAGVAAGVSVDFKVWYVPLLLLLALVARRRALHFLAGGSAAILAVYLPFFILAPVSMWRNVVTAQLGRPNQGLPMSTRIRSILGVEASAPDRPWWQVTGTVGVVAVLVVVVVLLALASSSPMSRDFVLVLIVSAAILLLSPSYLQHYATLTAGPLALVGGAGVGRIGMRLSSRWAAVPVVLAAALIAGGVNLAQDLGKRSTMDSPTGKVLPTAALQAATRDIAGCVISDDPTVLILMNRLSEDLARHCDVQADPSGIGFVLTEPGAPQVYRPQNPRFQREIVRYMHSAEAYVLVRGRIGLGLSPESLQVFKDDRVLARVGPLVLRTGKN